MFKYRWGARAEEEVDKRGLLSFTAEVSLPPWPAPRSPLPPPPPPPRVQLYGGDLSLWETQFRDVLENTKPMQGVRD